MGIITKEVEIKLSTNNVEYYKDLGYDIPMRPSTKSYYKRSGKEFTYDLGKTIMVKIEDLPLNSHAVIETTCDYCGNLRPPMKYIDYNKQTKNGVTKSCCSECRYLKGKETVLKKYGVENVLFLKEVQEKIKKTNFEKYGVENVYLNKDIRKKIQKTIIERYGVDNVSKNKNIQQKKIQTSTKNYGVSHPMQNKEYREKIKKTNLEKYGVEYISQSEEVKQKIKETNLQKYGVEIVSQSEEVKQKIKDTTLKNYGTECLLSLPEFHEHSRKVDMERYGVHHHLQNPEILAKQKDTFYKNGTAPTSKQQRYLNNLYCGELNYPLKMYNLDIYLPDEKINIEFDGSGHRLSCEFGVMTEKEFNRKEFVRNTVVKNAGIKQMRIISSKDHLPSDEILLQMLSHAKEYFSNYPNHSWIEFNVDTSTVRNAEQKEGSFFNYGELRKIKKSDLEECA